MVSSSRWKRTYWVLLAVLVNISIVVGELKLTWFLLVLLSYGNTWMVFLSSLYLAALLYVLVLAFNLFVCNLAFPEVRCFQKWVRAVSFIPVVPIAASLFLSWFATFR